MCKFSEKENFLEKHNERVIRNTSLIKTMFLGTGSRLVSKGCGLATVSRGWKRTMQVIFQLFSSVHSSVLEAKAHALSLLHIGDTCIYFGLVFLCGFNISQLVGINGMFRHI